MEAHIIKTLGKNYQYDSIKLLLKNDPSLQKQFDEIALELLLSTTPLDLAFLKVLLPEERISSTACIPNKVLFEQAFRNKHFAAIGYLLNKTMLEEYSDTELGELLLALVKNSFYLAKQLIALRPGTNKGWRMDTNHCNALHILMQMDYPDENLILTLYQNNPFCADQNKEGETPLSIGARKRHFDLIAKLCRNPEIIQKHSPPVLMPIIKELTRHSKLHIIKLITTNICEEECQVLAFNLLTEPKDLTTYVTCELLNSLLPYKKALLPACMPGETLFPILTQYGHFTAIKFFLDNRMLRSYSDNDLSKLLANLLRCDKADLAKQLMEQRPSVLETAFLENWTFLHSAMSGCTDWDLILKLCAQKPAHLLKQSTHKELGVGTPLLLGAKHHNFSIVSKLCQHEEFHVIENHPLDQLMEMVDIFNEKNQYDLIKLLLIKRPELQNHVEKIAFAYYEIELVKLLNKPISPTNVHITSLINLLQQRPFANLEIFNYLLNPLLQQKETLEKLLFQFVNIKALNTVILEYLLNEPMLQRYSNDELGRLLLKFVSCGNKNNFATLLIQQNPGLKKTIKDVYGNNALHYLCEQKNSDEKLALLLVENNDACAATNAYNETPLLRAANECNFSLVSLLLQRTEFIKQYSLQQLILVVKILKDYKKNDLIDPLLKQYPPLREADQTQKLFGLIDLTPEPDISREQIKNALLKLSQKDITVENLMIFLKHFLKLPPKTQGFFYKPDPKPVVKKVLDQLTNHKPVTLSSSDWHTLRQYHSLSRKIFDKFSTFDESKQFQFTR